MTAAFSLLAGVLCLIHVGAAQSSGGFSGFSVGNFWRSRYGGYNFNVNEHEEEVWRATGTVPEKTDTVPQAPLDVVYGPTKIYINGTYDTDQLLEIPKVRWEAEPDALYTLMIEDNGIILFPVKLMHYMVSNIRGNNVATGDIVASYVPPFTFTLNEEQTGLDTRTAEQGGEAHEFLFLVYKQKRLISIPEATSCAADAFTSRFYFHGNLKEEYELEGPVAGTFINIGYSRSGWTEYLLCKYSRCTGDDVPPGYPLPGINDKPECKKVE